MGISSSILSTSNRTSQLAIVQPASPVCCPVVFLKTTFDFEYAMEEIGEQSFLLSCFSDRFFYGLLLNFRLIQNSDRFSKHIGWFKMEQNPWGQDSEKHGTLIHVKLRLPLKIWPDSVQRFAWKTKFWREDCSLVSLLQLEIGIMLTYWSSEDIS